MLIYSGRESPALMVGKLSRFFQYLLKPGKRGYPVINLHIGSVFLSLTKLFTVMIILHIGKLSGPGRINDTKYNRRIEAIYGIKKGNCSILRIY